VHRSWFISSIAGLRSGSRLVAYDTSKAALGGLMRNVAREGARRGIRANIICPGLVRHRSAVTPAPAGRREALRERRLGGWRRVGDRLRRAFFISDESVYVNARRWPWTAASPGYEPKSIEKISPPQAKSRQ